MDIRIEPRFEAWRDAARTALAAGRAPDDVNWLEAGADEGAGLFHRKVAGGAASLAQARVPAAFVELAKSVAAHRHPGRWQLLYRTLWRLTHEDRDLLEVSVDDDVRDLKRFAAQVGRDIHKMHAFVRFRLTEQGEYVAWHVPDHHIVRLAVPFFVRRFRTMRWTIMTPDETATWDGETLRYLPGCPEHEAPKHADDLETLWLTYYGATFNPARIKVGMMKREMPVRHWRTLPETAIIESLLDEAPGRVAAMEALRPTSAAPFVPPARDLEALRAAAARCEGCKLCGPATQTVFGQGPRDARIVIVGEQPGDEEDRHGRPFIGPAGQLLRGALVEAGLDAEALYLTNAVKHFHFESNGKARLHKRPDSREVAACRPWLEAELATLQPDVLICLGVTAAQSVLGRAVRMSDERGRWQGSAFAGRTLVTFHPAAVLRATSEEQRAATYHDLVADLRSARVAMSFWRPMSCTSTTTSTEMSRSFR